MFKKIFNSDHLFRKSHLLLVLPFLLVIVALGAVYYFHADTLNKKVSQLVEGDQEIKSKFAKINQELSDLRGQDQYKINQQQAEEIKNIKDTYSLASKSFESLNDIRALGIKTDKLDPLYANALKQLADKNYASASSSLADLNKQIDQEKSKYSAAKPSSGGAAAAPAVADNSLPGGGYRRQSVQTDSGSFNVDIIAADLGSTKVIVDTASEGDCGNNCPALPLADYVSRNSAIAGINGSFFCPPEYPSCAGKTNSFDTLLMNKNKHYFNSDNNVYSTIPAAIFTSSGARFVSRSLEWGRDTSPDAVIANYPLLVLNNQAVYSELPNEPKFGGKGPRCFIAEKGNMVYIGIVYGATMADSAKVLKTLGLNSALNLDEGGSTALWYGGYKAGPGRNVPNAILFVRR